MNSSFTRPRGLALLFIVAALAITVGVIGCSNTTESPVAPSTSADQTWGFDNPQMQKVMAVQNAHTKQLMADQSIIGTATTLTDDGKPAIMILVTTDAAFKAAPVSIEGIPVKVVLTDPIVAMKGKPGGGGGGESDHQGIQTPPIKLGTSGGWRYDLANGYCCGGTLGSLIQVGSQKRILSNYHVFEADIVNGGNGRKASNGDPIIQPALIDVGCNANNAQDVATLVVSSKLPGSNVDASTANIISGMVRDDGYILEIGTISATTAAAYIGQDVKKSGRTSGLTRSSVGGLNATVSITYENECAGGTAFTKTFTGQILVDRGGKFLKGGDSGSLMVEDVTTNPKAVGLLFAGSRTIAVANPIDEVLSAFNATMVGN